MSGHTKWSEIKASRGLTGKWVAVAGDDRVKHYFTDTVRPHWWQAAKCGKGPAVGDSASDARLGSCTKCLPVEPEDLEDVEGIRRVPGTVAGDVPPEAQRVPFYPLQAGIVVAGVVMASAALIAALRRLLGRRSG